jgi:hypothetical protein
MLVGTVMAPKNARIPAITFLMTRYFVGISKGLQTPEDRLPRQFEQGALANGGLGDMPKQVSKMCSI